MDLLKKFLIPGSFMVSDTDESGSTDKYYGYLALDGSWYILKASTSAGVTTYRYVRGRPTSNQASGGDYATNWTNRASLTGYGYVNAVFI